MRNSAPCWIDFAGSIAQLRASSRQFRRMLLSVSGRERLVFPGSNEQSAPAAGVFVLDAPWDRACRRVLTGFRRSIRQRRRKERRPMPGVAKISLASRPFTVRLLPLKVSSQERAVMSTLEGPAHDLVGGQGDLVGVVDIGVAGEERRDHLLFGRRQWRQGATTPASASAVDPDTRGRRCGGHAGTATRASVSAASFGGFMVRLLDFRMGSRRVALCAQHGTTIQNSENYHTPIAQRP